MANWITYTHSESLIKAVDTAKVNHTIFKNTLNFYLNFKLKKEYNTMHGTSTHRD